MRGLLTLAAAACLVAPAYAQGPFPPNGSTVQTLRPVFGYDFGQPVRDERILIDGHDFTHIASRNGFRIQITPSVDLPVGTHTVQVSARNLVGLPLGHTWQFTVVNPNAPPPAPVNTAPKITPGVDAVVTSARPPVQLEYGEALRSAKLWLDGNEQTQHLRISGNTVSFTPPQDLSRGRHQLSTQVLLASGRTDNQSWSIDVQPPQAQSSPRRYFSDFSPPRGASLPNLRPFISADFRGQLSDVRLIVDNTDVTNMAQLSDSRISWTPSYDVAPGAHRVRVQGRDQSGKLVDAEWDFTVQGAQNPSAPNPPAAVEVSVDEPLTGDRVDKVFDVHGSAPPGSAIRIVLRPLPRKNKVVQFKGVADRAGYFSVPVSTSWAPKGSRIEVNVTALNAKTGKKLAEPYVVEVYRK